jgi:hypothetical protein
MLALGEQHMRPDRCPQRQEQRQQADAIDIFIPCFRQVAVEHRICRLSLIEVDQVHQRKRQIVEDIRGGDHRIEFDGVEQ